MAKFRSAYDGVIDRSSDISFKDQRSLTKQEMSAACDINNILAKYRKTGLVSHLATGMASYSQFVDGPDFHAAMNQVTAAQQSFMLLPAEVRAEFGNDPGMLISALSDPSQKDRLIKVGLWKEAVLKAAGGDGAIATKPTAADAPPVAPVEAVKASGA